MRPSLSALLEDVRWSCPGPICAAKTVPGAGRGMRRRGFVVDISLVNVKL